ncbi:MAG: GNAT family N-acetyltransferase [Candidatus Dormibacteria bacterium]
MMSVRELPRGETHLATAPILALRPHLGSAADCIAVIDDVQRREGFRVVAAFEPAHAAAVAYAGFRIQHFTAWGRTLYVDDLSTLPDFRGRGHAQALFDWLVETGRHAGCASFHLDSGPTRHNAHRFYLNNRLALSAYHFGAYLDDMRPSSNVARSTGPA